MTQSIYRFGIVGAGMIAEFHARAINAMAGAELVAVFARSSADARRFGAEHNCAAYDEYDAFLAHQGLDLVTICTPSGAHLAFVEPAAKSGKHIICEKPLEVTVERVDKMISICEESNVMLAGNFPRRFNAATQLLKSAVEAGRFGEIAFADAYVKWWRTQEYFDSGAWRGTWFLDGGGAIMNQSIHTIDLLLHIMGDVNAVRAETRLVAHSNLEVEDTGLAMLEFESGAMGVIQGSTACWSGTGHPAEIQICGSKGSVFMSDDKFKVWEFIDYQPNDIEILAEHGMQQQSAGAGAADPRAIDFTWHQRNFEDAVLALRENRAPAIHGKEGRRAVALINAIYRSASMGGEKQVVA